jgi:hypothetical protein
MLLLQIHGYRDKSQERSLSVNQVNAFKVNKVGYQQLSEKLEKSLD